MTTLLGTKEPEFQPNRLYRFTFNQTNTKYQFMLYCKIVFTVNVVCVPTLKHVVLNISMCSTNVKTNLWLDTSTGQVIAT